MQYSTQVVHVVTKLAKSITIVYDKMFEAMSKIQDKAADEQLTETYNKLDSCICEILLVRNAIHGAIVKLNSFTPDTSEEVFTSFLDDFGNLVEIAKGGIEAFKNKI